MALKFKISKCLAIQKPTNVCLLRKVGINVKVLQKIGGLLREIRPYCEEPLMDISQNEGSDPDDNEEERDLDGLTPVCKII